MQNNTEHLLAERMRPSASHLQCLLGPAKKIWDKDLAKWRNGHKFHIILWGPPGSGKTTLARLLGETMQLSFITLSAVRDGVKEIRNAVAEHPGGLIFIDEIHRLNRAQQDALLPILEYAEAWIIGATTEAPNVELSAPILSRVRNIYVAKLTTQDIVQGLKNSLSSLALTPEIQEHLTNFSIPNIAKMSGGDLRFALNLLENISQCTNAEEEQEIYQNFLKAFSSKSHYDFVSAMIKSMRGSDPDAALFYAITSLDKGEDPLFILRRCIIFASEDVGNADPQAVTLAVSAYHAVQYVGMPEGRIPLAQCVTYLASTVKSNRAYAAISKVRAWREQVESSGGSLQPPAALTLKGQNSYKYPHSYANAFVSFNYLPADVAEVKAQAQTPAYLPSDFGAEQRIKKRLAELWNDSTQ